MDLSVIIPAYNAKDYIAACLRSVTCCPKTDFEMECIVVSDGSVDDTEAIVKRYIERDKRIKLVVKENSGVSETRNVGLAYATGKYIMFLDSDDCLVEDAWEYLIRVIKSKEADYMAFSYITLYENGKMKPHMLPLSADESVDMQEGQNLMLASSEFNTCWGKLFLKSIIEEHQIRFRKNLPIGEDFLFVLEYFSYCESYYMSKAMILYYLQRSGSAMRSYSMEQRLDFMKVLYGQNRLIVDRYHDEALLHRMQVYYLRVLTNLFYEFAKIHRGKELQGIYRKTLMHETVQRILNEVPINEIYSGLKKFEYQLLRNQKTGLAAAYFRLKAKL